MKTLVALAALSAVAFAADQEWAKGIKYTTDWNAAIKEARSTGRILFIYNGWERAGI